MLGLAFLRLQMHSDLMNTCTNVLTQYQFFSGFFLKGIASEALMCTLAFLTFLYITFLWVPHIKALFGKLSIFFNFSMSPLLILSSNPEKSSVKAFVLRKKCSCNSPTAWLSSVERWKIRSFVMWLCIVLCPLICSNKPFIYSHTTILRNLVAVLSAAILHPVTEKVVAHM